MDCWHWQKMARKRRAKSFLASGLQPRVCMRRFGSHRAFRTSSRSLSGEVLFFSRRVCGGGTGSMGFYRLFLFFLLFSSTVVCKLVHSICTKKQTKLD